MKSHLLLVFFLFPFLINAQTSGNSNYLPANLSLIPPSPDVSSLNKYIDVPVNTYSGLADISFPIFTIKAGMRTLPITLNYHTGGIKTEDNASWVGLGWSLNTGGNISRTLNGLADEEAGVGFLNLPEVTYVTSPFYRADGESTLNPTTSPDRVTAYALGLQDSEPDLFYFSAGDKSGKFLLDRVTKQPNLFIHDKVKITHSDDFTSWTIVNPDGVTYFYNQLEIINTSNASYRGGNKTYTSAWLLQKIQYPDSKDFIEFIYDDYNSMFYNGFSETDYYKIKHESFSFGTSNVSCNYSMSDFLTYSSSKNRNIVQGKYLSKIIFPEGSIVFNKNVIDIDPKRFDYLGSKYLKNIQVFDNSNKLIQQYNLSYAYFGETGEIPMTTNTLNYETVRLKLLNLAKVSGPIKEEYGFEYNDIDLPNKFTKSKDHWGFYNGKLNTILLPETYISWYNNLFLSGADRTTSETFSKAGMIKKITYPTGGYSLYDFEPNDCRTNSLPDNTVSSYLTLTKTAINIPQSLNINLINRPNIELTMQVLPVIPPSCVLKIEITKPTGDILTYTYSTMHQNEPDLQPIHLWLPMGAYSIKCTTLGATLPDGEPFVNFSWLNEIITNKKLAGGLRVKTIKQFDPQSNKTLTKKYTYTTNFGDSVSSGHLFSIPKYDYFYYDRTTEYIARTSTPNNDLTYTQGSPVGYSRVAIEELDELGSNNGVIENFYTSQEFPDYYYHNTLVDYNPYTSQVPSFPSSIPEYPYTMPSESNEWRRGLLTKTVVYKKNNANLIITSKSENTYKFYVSTVSSTNENPLSSYLKINNATKAFIGHNNKPEGFINYNGGDPCQLNYLDGYCNKAYSIFTGMYAEKTSTKEIVYDENGNTILSETFYSYDINTHNLIETKKRNSKGIDNIQKFKFPSTMIAEGNNPNGIYSEMLNRNIWNKQIEGQAYYGSSFLSSNKTNYLYSNNGSWVSSPIGSFILPNTEENQKSGSNSEIIARYETYDADGNLTTVSKENNVKIAFLYDYNNSYPIVQATNATNASISATSFEADGKSNWDWATGGVVTTGAITGKKSFNLNGYNITRTGLNSATTYVITYWKKGSGSCSLGGSAIITKNGWTLYQTTITGITSLTISGTGNIDELRLYPKDAQMTTYTYDPLIGMTSQCDVNNRISYYEYDSFNRLLRIRDQDNNIIKSFEYKYQQTP